MALYRVYSCVGMERLDLKNGLSAVGQSEMTELARLDYFFAHVQSLFTPGYTIDDVAVGVAPIWAGDVVHGGSENSAHLRYVDADQIAQVLEAHGRVSSGQVEAALQQVASTPADLDPVVEIAYRALESSAQEVLTGAMALMTAYETAHDDATDLLIAIQ